MQTLILLGARRFPPEMRRGGTASVAGAARQRGLKLKLLVQLVYEALKRKLLVLLVYDALSLSYYAEQLLLQVLQGNESGPFCTSKASKLIGTASAAGAARQREWAVHCDAHALGNCCCSQLGGCRQVCSRMLTYAHVCSRMLACAYVCSCMLTHAHVCSRMLTYDDVC